MNIFLQYRTLYYDTLVSGSYYSSALYCGKLISFEMEYKKDFQISILNHHPWSHLKLNYKPNSTLIFIISILTFFSEVQFSALFLVLFILLTQLLWLNISSFIWLNVKLNTAFATVVFNCDCQVKEKYKSLEILIIKAALFICFN